MAELVGPARWPRTDPAVFVYIYVGERANDNFAVGMSAMVWGWKDPDRGALAGRAVEWLRRPQQTTYLVFAKDVVPARPVVGWPRTPDGEMSLWEGASVSSMTLARLDGALYQATERIWSDSTYPFRVRFSSITAADGPVRTRTLHPDALLAIRNSALRQGRPMLGPDPGRADGPESFDAPGDRDDLDGPEISDRLLTGLEGLDGSALRMTRREQRRLRLRMFGSRPDVVCALCGRRLPTDLVRLAHIKRRAEASFDERLTFANTMPACTLGCDEMFERGYILVDEYGHIQANRNLGGAPDLYAVIAPLVGRVVVDYQPSQAHFFQWHRDRHGS